MVLAGALSLGLVAGPAAASPSAGSPAAQIKANWLAFFDGRTAAAKKVGLLEDGKSFAQVIAAQSKSPLARGVSAKVLSVQLSSKTSARVRYTLYEDGVAALKDESGTAVLQGGTWKVGVSSFCALLHLEGAKVPACPGKG
jgi:hypothetical protein